MVEAGLGGRYDATNVLGARGRGAHQRRARAHALARPDDRRHRGREARGRAAEARRWCSATTRPRSSRCAERDGRDDRPARGTPVADCADAPSGLPAAQLRGRRARPPRRSSAAARPDVRRAPSPPVAVSRAACRSSASDPLTISTARTTRPGSRRCAELRPEGTVAVLSILDDKDAAEMLRALLPRLSRRRLHPRAEPAGAAAGDAGRPRVEGRRASERDRARSASRRRARARTRWRTEPCSPRARSTLLPTCSVRPARVGRARCERRRPQRHRDDRARGGRRGGRHPDLLRHRLRVRPRLS